MRADGNPPSQPTAVKSSGVEPRLGYQDFFDAPWIGGVFRPVLIAVVAASIVAGPIAALRVLGASWQLDYLLPLAWLVAMEGVYSTLRLGRPSGRDRRGLLFRLAEIVLILALLQIAIWAFSSGWPQLTDLLLWLRHPLAFLTGQFIFLAIWICAAWGLAIGITSDFLDLALQADEVAAHDHHVWGESRNQLQAGRAVSRGDILARFVTRWTVGGVLLVFFTSLSQVSLTTGAGGQIALGLRGLGLPAELMAALLCYFLAGLLLISQARLAVLRGRWYNQDIDVQPTVLRRWHANSVFAVALIALLAALLPMGTTSWLAGLIAAVMGFIMRAAYLLLTVLLVLFSLLLWPLRFLTRDQAGEAPPPIAPPPQIPTQAEAVSRLPDWLGGAVLWTVIALIVVYFALTYLRAQGRLRGKPLAWLQRLRYWWRARWAKAQTALSAAVTQLGKRLHLPRRGEPSAPQLSAVRVSALSPRARVRYFYLRMVSRAAERGLARRPHQTPREFASLLESQLPDAEMDVEMLTEAFLAARYDTRPIPAPQAQATQTVWRRVMRALRDKTHPTE